MSNANSQAVARYQNNFLKEVEDRVEDGHLPAGRLQRGAGRRDQAAGREKGIGDDQRAAPRSIEAADQFAQTTGQPGRTLEPSRTTPEWETESGTTSPTG